MWDSPVHWRVVNSIPVFYPRGASSTFPLTSCDNQKCLQLWPHALCRENIAPGEDRITGLLCNSASWPAATPCPQGRSFLFVCVKPVGFQCSDKEEEEAASHSPRPHFFIFVVKRCLHSTHTRCSQWQQECPFTLQNNPLPSSVLVLCTFSIFAFLF